MFLLIKARGSLALTQIIMQNNHLCVRVVLVVECVRTRWVVGCVREGWGEGEGEECFVKLGW